MNYAPVSIETAATEVKRLHEGIESKMRSSVEDAIRIGEILSQVREKKGHGDFLPWVSTLSFSNKTAYRYISLYEYKSKIVTMTNLQEAYKQVATLEAQEKQSEEKKAWARVKEYKKTGVKPEGWRRGTDDKLFKEEIERDIRIHEAGEAAKKWQKEREEREARAQKSRAERDSILDEGFGFINSFLEKEKGKLAFIQKIGLSGNNASHAFNDALITYLETLKSDSEKIEACHNIIKICKGVVSELQQKSIRGGV